MYCEIPLTYTDMTLGTSVKLNVFSDKVKLKIPSGTKTNTVFRLKGKGFNDVNRRSGSGSLYVKVITEIPDSMTREYKQKLKDLAECEEKTIKKDILKKYKNYIKE
jgi:molecular chaperone DnaJ